jgi:hypothetical protein
LRGWLCILYKIFTYQQVNDLKSYRFGIPAEKKTSFA